LFNILTLGTNWISYLNGASPTLAEINVHLRPNSTSWESQSPTLVLLLETTLKGDRNAADSCIRLTLKRFAPKSAVKRKRSRAGSWSWDSEKGRFQTKPSDEYSAPDWAVLSVWPRVPL